MYVLMDGWFCSCTLMVVLLDDSLSLSLSLSALPGFYNHQSQSVLQGIYWLTYLVNGVEPVKHVRDAGEAVPACPSCSRMVDRGLQYDRKRRMDIERGFWLLYYLLVAVIRATCHYCGRALLI